MMRWENTPILLKDKYQNLFFFISNDFLKIALIYLRENERERERERAPAGEGAERDIDFLLRVDPNAGLHFRTRSEPEPRSVA